MTTSSPVSTEAHRIPTESLTGDARTGGDVLVEVMKEAGAEVAFGVISIHNLPLVEAVDRELRFVPVRHEAAAVNAADGYARATGRIGVALTSTGTGAGNAAGAMVEALAASSRVLHITGNINADLIGEGKGAYHEVPRQLQMLEAVSAHALRVETPRQARAVRTEAVHLAESAPNGPVSVDWPIDLQYLAKPDEQNTVQERSTALRTGARRDIQRAAALLREARRPLIWAGGGARQAGADVLALAEAWGAGVLTGTNGRGTVPEDHRLLIGNFPADEAVLALWEEADCLLTIGSHLRGNETQNFTLPLPEKHVQIDLDAEVIGLNFPVAVGLQADARSAVAALLEELGEPATEEGWDQRVREAADAARAGHRKDIGAYAAICDAMRDRLPRRAVIVRDVTVPGSSWGNRLLSVYDARDNIFAAGGGIGQGLAMAIGAGVGRPKDPVLAIVGDGGLAVHQGELAVLAAETPDVVLVVFNDAGYGVLRNLQKARGVTKRAVDLLTPDFALLAESVGLRHKLVGTPEDFDKALKKALKRGGPSVIEVDVPALRPRPADMVPPIEVPSAESGTD
ncbi:thiamine pyrophosphate-binding protein [Micrococcus sp.]|uniref:thiamine pyrophosphate-binding protein n=1 Tax=Micrococcus sp. TaxID=1271 RepID=UPI002A91B5DF|nr:thiamine pyrophosphate-binding protein [Micrococcus sp.]MDY6054719.1 thiamine pyrophosphate-binding protein [Micrococcus sp.]